MATSFSSLATKIQLDNCTYCPKMCRHACPVSTAAARETFIPQEKMANLGRLQRGEEPYTQDSTDSLWACTGCRHCTVYCEHDNEPGLVLFAGRAQANAQGVGHPSLQNYPERFSNRERRLASLLHQFVKDNELKSEGSTGYWPGCDTVAKSIVDVSLAMSAFAQRGCNDVKVVKSPQVCAGYPLLASGYLDNFRQHAAQVAKSVTGFRQLIIGCSACLHTLRAQYPAEGIELTPKVVALAEFLADQLEQRPQPQQPAQERPVVYYHDPCYLSRYENVIEQPRRVLAELADVREFAWSREDSECCGGAGILPKTMPDIADAMAQRRLRDIAMRGGGMVVTSCSTCSFMLKRNAPDGIEVFDLPMALDKLSSSKTFEKI